ncbi:MAG: hypothetical protein ACTSUE_00370 [Promethearchaeota archaeon]
MSRLMERITDLEGIATWFDDKPSEQIAAAIRSVALEIKEISLEMSLSNFNAGNVLYDVHASLVGIAEDLEYPAFGIIFHFDEHSKQDLEYLISKLITIEGGFT